MPMARWQVPSKGGQSAPRTFTQMRDEAQAELAKLEISSASGNKPSSTSRTSYEKDKLRFRELKAASPLRR
jgi:hypothetical protein